jgi:uncharacterized membrane protein YjfL (UPF0719 family)
MRFGSQRRDSMGTLLLNLAQLLIAIVLSAAATFLSFYVVQWLTRDLDEWEALRQGNPAVGLVLGSTLVAVALMLRPALAVDTATWDVGYQIYARVLLAEALQLAIGLVLAVVALGLAVVIFAGLTRGVDEIEELASGNLAVAGLLAGVVIGVALMVSQAVGQIMTAVSSLLF